MTDYTPIANLPVAVDDLATAATAQALRDNPVAIAEGAEGAPKVVPAALGSPLLAVVQEENLTSGALTVLDLANLDRIGTIKADAAMFAVTGGVEFYMDLSADAGATWYTQTVLVAEGIWTGQIIFDLINAVAYFFKVDVEKSGGLAGDTLTFASAAQGANRLRLRVNAVLNNNGTDFFAHVWAMSGKP